MKKKSKLSAIWQLICWVYSDALKHHAKQAIAFVILSGTAVGMQLGAFICAAYYARVLEANKPFEKFGLLIESPRDSIELLIAIAILIAGALIAAATLNYFARRLSLQLSLIYEQVCVERVLNIAQDLPVIGNKLLSESIIPARLGRLVGADARSCGRMLRVCLLALFPAAVVVLAGLILLKLNWMLTLFLMCVLPFGAIGYLQINRTGVKVAHAFEASQSKLGKIIHEHAVALGNPMPENFETLSHSNREDYARRLLSVDKIRCLTQIMTALALCAVILFFGISSLYGKTSITYFVLYLLILRYGMNNLLSLSTLTSSLSASYPAIKRYRSFIAAYEGLTPGTRHCEEVIRRSNPANESDCFAPLAMTKECPSILTYEDLHNKIQHAPLGTLGPVIILSNHSFTRQEFAPIAGALSGSGHVLWSKHSDKIDICDTLADLNHPVTLPYGKFIWLNITQLSPSDQLNGTFAVYADNGKVRGGDFLEVIHAFRINMSSRQTDRNDPNHDHEEYYDEG